MTKQTRVVYTKQEFLQILSRYLSIGQACEVVVTDWETISLNGSLAMALSLQNSPLIVEEEPTDEEIRLAFSQQ